MADFITTWQTTNENESITIPTTPSSILVYNYDVDWGDGTIETGFTGNSTHTYAIAGEYDVKITGVFPRIHFNNTGDKEKILGIKQWGDIEWKSMDSAFKGSYNLDIEAQDLPKLSSLINTSLSEMFSGCSLLKGNISINNWNVDNITNMAYMFYGCTNFNQDIVSWDVSSVTNMASMFYGCTNFNQDIGSWNISMVTNMRDMFYGAANFNQDIGSWDVSQVTDMASLFLSCTNFNQDIGNWDVSQVTSMLQMFYGCTNFNQDIGSWNVSNITNMGSIFHGCTNFNQDIGSWDVSQVTYMPYVFSGATNFNQDIGNWDTGQVTNIFSMFSGATNFNQDIGSWDVSQVTHFYQMFYNATNFDQDIGSWDVSKVTNMHYMFVNCKLSTQNYDALLMGWSQLALQENIEFDGGNSNYCNGELARTKLIEDFGWTITDAGKDADCVPTPNDSEAFITTWETTEANESITIPVRNGFVYNYDIDWGDGTVEVNLTGAGSHIYATAGVFEVKVTGEFPAIFFWNTGDKEKITSIKQWGNIAWKSMQSAFQGCSNLDMKAQDLPDFSQLTSMSIMFSDCSSLHGNESMNNWDVSIVTEMNAMFYNCTNFNQDIGRWDVVRVSNMSFMFNNCTNFNQDISGWSVSQVTNMNATFNNCTNFNQNLGSWDVIRVNNMNFMFSRCRNFNHDISNWEVGQVVGMSSMFNLCTNFNQDIGNWDVSQVASMSFMFSGCINFNQDIGSWNVGKVTKMSNMFQVSTNFNQDLGDWDVGQVNDMSSMFSGCTNFNQDLGSWNVSQVTNMNVMFRNCTNFNQDIGGWNVSNVINMQDMFFRAKLSTQNYDALLIGWSKLQLQSNVEFHGGTSNYCNGEIARTKLIEDFGWTITDAGKDAACVSLVDINQSIITVDPNTIIANGTDISIITVTLNDADGTIIVSPTNAVIITTSLGVVTTTINNNDGTYTAELTSNEVGTATLSFTVDAQEPPNTAAVILAPFIIEITENTKIQSPSFYLQASGSNGTDGSAIGVHTRWGFKGELGTKHLPKGDLAQSSYNYNKPNDYVWLYRTPYQKVERIIDFSTLPKVVDHTNGLWIYEIDTKRFTISFKDKTAYNTIQNTINPLQNPLSFMENYGDGLIEIECKRDLFFGVTIATQNAVTNSVLQAETLSAVENTLMSLKKVSNRKTVTGTAINNCRFLCDNGRTLRFKASNHTVSAIKIELYEDLITNTNDSNSWTSLGKYSLTLDDEVALKQLEPETNLVHGKWPKFNDGATVNIDNYIHKWNVSGTSEEDRNLKDVIEKYIELSDAFDNPSGIEELSFGNLEVTNPEEDIMEISNLDMLNLAATDYHIARMLGLGNLDIAEEVSTGDYVYLAEYTTIEQQPHPTEEVFYAEIKHLAISLPTSIDNQRLPVPLDLEEIAPGAKFDSESPNTVDLTDENGYTHDGKKRYVTLYLEDTYEEAYNPSFFQNTFEFELNEITYPVFVGLEHRDIASGGVDDTIWNKPEISHDLRYFNIDTTVSEEAKKYEPFPLVLPEDGAPLLIHKQTTSGTHYYGVYSINLFSRVSPTNNEVLIITDLIPTNPLLPPSNIQVQLIQEEQPVLLTSNEEQERRKDIADGEDKTLARVTFDYHSVHEMVAYQIPDSTIYSDDELLNNPEIIFSDSDEVYADEVDVFFRNELPQNVSGKIIRIEDDPNDILISIITVDEYNLVSIGELLTPTIVSGKEENYVGGLFVIGTEQYIIYGVTNISEFPVFKVYKKEISDSLVESEIPSVDAENLQSPQIIGDGLFMAIENMQNVSSWNSPNPFATKVNLGNYPVKREIIEKQVDEDNLQRFLQKSRGVWSDKDFGDTTITEELEVINQDGDMEFRGIYRIVFHGVQLNQHTQFSAAGNSVEWHRGIIRIPFNTNSKSERKVLKVLKIFNIVNEDTIPSAIKDLELLVYDESYATTNKQIQVGNNVSVNFYPGYKCYFYTDDTYNFNEENVLPSNADESDVRSTILGFRSYDTSENYYSKISTPSILIGQRLIAPKTPEEPTGSLYATRPDYFGRSSYKITNKYKHKPHGVLFYRTNDEALLNAVYEKETIVKIKEDLENIFGDNDTYFANRWKNFIDFAEILEVGDYKTFPEDETLEHRYKFPNPDKKVFFEWANSMITKLNESLDASEDPNQLFNVNEASDDYEVGTILVGSDRLIGFFRDAILNSFVPLTKIPIVYNYINSKEDYIPVNKKQTIRDKDGLVLKPNDEEFDMAPMMKITGESDYETEFVDFTLDGTSNNSYFYGVREMSSRMMLGEFGTFLGPIKLVNSNPPEAPEVKRIMPVLENKINNTSAGIQIEINPYPSIQNIKRINIYRAFNTLDAQSVRTMTFVKTIDVNDIGVSLGNYWVLKDELEEVSEIPFGEGLFYKITVDREVEYADKTGAVLLDYIPSQSSKIVATILVESSNPSTPKPVYVSDPIDAIGVLHNVVLNWEKTCYNGKYHVYKMNTQGNWEKIHELKSNEETISLDLMDTLLHTNSINTLDSEGNFVYSHFKVIAENTSGMFSNEDYIVTIPKENTIEGIGEMSIGETFVVR